MPKLNSSKDFDRMIEKRLANNEKPRPKSTDIRSTMRDIISRRQPRQPRV